MNPNMADFGGIPRAAGGPGLGSDYRLAAMPFAHFAIKAQRRKAARLRKLRRRFIRPGGAAPQFPRCSIHYRSRSNPR